jgi:PadR family transcriptional regulator PadR
MYLAMHGKADGDPDPVARWEVQLRKGGLELAILAVLWGERLYGLEILRRLEDGSSLVVTEGTVYPLLARLKAEGWVDAEWVEAEAGHPRKYYRLTPSGRRHAQRLARSWSSFAAGVDRLLAPLRREDR